MAKSLQLNFTTAAGKQTSLTVDEPKAGLTPAEVEAAMQEIIASQVFEVDGSFLATVRGARIIGRTVEELVKA
ncbi:DUF2922 domain-containing protein [Sporosarcina thermotolerans]|uniref:DUF2922 domain-containing protein n=1 Tax=Sporosarcina thermotolerans TaxID=633404 RepID=A0AAW9AB71_9BACL|nr:DUF2922 domain-containing protein [Sporosarcina thermotolerans]MDW0117454.1 DUF2922 domain-containing protein [Sporosarcina thermotolerans]WHT49632.1 DUF2922 domain-containing protein [Sporosarcina thermotolerans]